MDGKTSGIWCKWHSTTPKSSSLSSRYLFTRIKQWLNLFCWLLMGPLRTPLHANGDLRRKQTLFASILKKSIFINILQRKQATISNFNWPNCNMNKQVRGTKFSWKNTGKLSLNLEQLLQTSTGSAVALFRWNWTCRYAKPLFVYVRLSPLRNGVFKTQKQEKEGFCTELRCPCKEQLWDSTKPKFWSQPNFGKADHSIHFSVCEFHLC